MTPMKKQRRFHYYRAEAASAFLILISLLGIGWATGALLSSLAHSLAMTIAAHAS